MSADEDTELRDLVAQTLESNGVLSKIRAQLRANVFLALEEQETVQNKTPFLNKELKSYLGTKEGRTVAGLVKEFLQFFNLGFSLSVFESESGLGEQYEGRAHLACSLDITETAETARLPLLAELSKRRRTTSSSAPSSPTHNFVDSKNKKNDDDSHSSFKSSPREDSVASDSDSFFDEAPKRDKKSPPPTLPKPPATSGGLPSLSNNSRVDSPRTPDMDIKDIDRKITDLGFDIPDDSYDDDFESSNLTPLGQTPRSARSDNNVKSIEEEIDEEIEEEDDDFSGAEDLLKSDPSAMDDLTTDRTVSPTDHSAVFDYMEDVLP